VSAPREELDRNEPATAYKLDKAHERGSIVRSADVTFAVVLLAATAVAYGLAESAMRNASGLFAFALRQIDRDAFSAPLALGLTGAVFWQALQLAAPLLAVIWFAATLTAALQARGVFTSEPLKPDFNRLNPAAGFKKLFSVRSLHELLRSSIKLAVLGAAGFGWGLHHLRDFVAAAAFGPSRLLHLGVSLLGSALALCAGLFVVFAILDYGFNRWEFLRQMRMSKREVKDEHKDREGDPRIKARLRELRMEMTRRARSIARVKDADVLLTNPTHYAVALQYTHGRMPAPMVTAKGAGEMAARLRAEARRCGVPVVEQPPLTRAIYAEVEADGYVPEAQFAQVARILRWVYAARRTPLGTAGVSA
jgi:flagellar biosynthesis protein FlhB